MVTTNINNPPDYIILMSIIYASSWGLFVIPLRAQLNLFFWEKNSFLKLKKQALKFVVACDVDEQICSIECVILQYKMLPNSHSLKFIEFA